MATKSNEKTTYLSFEFSYHEPFNELSNKNLIAEEFDKIYNHFDKCGLIHDSSYTYYTPVYNHEFLNMLTDKLKQNGFITEYNFQQRFLLVTYKPVTM